MEPEFHGKIKGNRLLLNRPEVYWAYCAGLKDGDYYLKIFKQKGPAKTIEQLAYYYAVIVPTAFAQMIEDGNDTFVVKIGKQFKEVPLTKEIVDDLLKEACAKFEGKQIILKRNMSKEEASMFIDNCIRWCARWLGCVIPEPDKGDLK